MAVIPERSIQNTAIFKSKYPEIAMELSNSKRFLVINMSSLEDTVILLYRQGITTAEIAELIEKMCGHYYSRGTISNMTASVQKEVEAFHRRILEKQYVVVYADATYLNVSSMKIRPRKGQSSPS